MFFDRPLFDLNNDGKTSLEEAFLEFMAMEEVLGDDPKEHGNNIILDDEDDGDMELQTVEADYSWREDYYDNAMGIDPDEYETLEDFLFVYEPVYDGFCQISSNLIKEELEKLKSKQDIRVAAALLFIELNENMETAKADIATDILLKEVCQYGITREYLEFVADQLRPTVIKLKNESGEETIRVIL